MRELIESLIAARKKVRHPRDLEDDTRDVLQPFDLLACRRVARELGGLVVLQNQNHERHDDGDGRDDLTEGRKVCEYHGAAPLRVRR